MRPNLTFILVILAIVISITVGIVSGGGWQVWVSEPVIGTVANENAALPNAPPGPTPLINGASAGGTPTAVTTVPARPSPSPVATGEPESLTITIRADNVRFHDAPEAAAVVIARLERGTEARATARSGDGAWYRAEVEGIEISGWLVADTDQIQINGDPDLLPVVE